MECVGQMIHNEKVDTLELQCDDTEAQPEPGEQLPWPTAAESVPTAGEWPWLLPEGNVLRLVNLWVPLRGLAALRAVAGRLRRSVRDLRVYVDDADADAAAPMPGLEQARSLTITWQNSSRMRGTAAATHALVVRSAPTLGDLSFQSDGPTDSPLEVVRDLLGRTSWPVLRTVAVTVAAYRSQPPDYVAAMEQIAVRAPQVQYVTWSGHASGQRYATEILRKRFGFGVIVEGQRVAPTVGPYTVFRWFREGNFWNSRTVCVTDVDTAGDHDAVAPEARLDGNPTSLRLNFSPSEPGGKWRHPAVSPVDVWNWFVSSAYHSLETVRLDSEATGFRLLDFLPKFKLPALQTMSVAFRDPARPPPNLEVAMFAAELALSCPALQSIRVDVSQCAKNEITTPMHGVEGLRPGVAVTVILKDRDVQFRSD